eukprot:TRINITY_DN19826_c0_g1_i1.p1 TRINITY_DN19826_c0_g1~~TRINITY_DN19826_c0_g1_i1.p1  ORF type:complete len:874 (+),score=228.59 TRINITY_DN19826_c0_g1_i1:375-2624(+)
MGPMAVEDAFTGPSRARQHSVLQRNSTDNPILVGRTRTCDFDAEMTPTGADLSPRMHSAPLSPSRNSTFLPLSPQGRRTQGRTAASPVAGQLVNSPLPFDCDGGRYDPLRHPLWYQHHALGRIPNERQDDWRDWYKALEAVTADADLWCGFFSRRPGVADGCIDGNFVWGDCAVDLGTAKPTRGRRGSLAAVKPEDNLECVLESLYDLTPARVEQIFNRFAKAVPGKMSVSELGAALRNQGLYLDTVLRDVMAAVDCDRDHRIYLPEFDIALTRLKLANLFVNHEFTDSAVLSVVDYSIDKVHDTPNVPRDKYKDFFFGHRQLARGSSVRWVHMSGLDKTLLLCLAVKYHLKPLGVEDAMSLLQPTKVDRYGSHYFVALDIFSLSPQSADGGSVRITKEHGCIFSSGAPSFDTVITISLTEQEEPSAPADPPGVNWFGLRSGTSLSNASAGSGSRPSTAASNPLNALPPSPQRQMGTLWATLRRMINAGRSLRVREKRGDFLLYEVLNCVVDELFPITVAYRARLTFFRARMNQMKHRFDTDSLNEISEIMLELMELLRVIRPLRQVLRHFIEDSAFGDEDVRMNLDDTRSHLEQVTDDIGQLRDICKSLNDEYNRHNERKLNDTLFFLTCASAIFMPAQFLSGVYGMNFQYDGQPSIPELNLQYGYFTFWVVVGIWFVISTYLAWRNFGMAGADSAGEREGRGSEGGTGDSVLGSPGTWQRLASVRRGSQAARRASNATSGSGTPDCL